MIQAEVKYKNWVHDRLQPDLTQIQEKIKCKQSDLQELKLLAEYVTEQHKICEEERLIDIGEGVMATASIERNGRIFLNIGLGFCCECTMEEAQSVVPLLQQKVQQQLEQLHQKAVEIRTHIEIAQEALKVIQE
eukprot:TRINITY_DN35466_c2_g2_i1.p4 TRINITY_DN35466_c2_g2~~TRINITY_DN35466_c2_g2_i1.p4  ORF type:complete len:134 (+),score=14.77 TRINITY_DN35466_c2_g2_i1:193-594(+)